MEKRTIDIISKIHVDTKEIQMNDMRIKGFVDFSKFKKLETLHIKSNEIKKIKLPKTLKELYIQKNKIRKIKLPKNLEILDISFNRVIERITFNEKIKTLNMQDCNIKDLDLRQLEQLDFLNISHNHFETLEKLPQNLTHLDVSYNIDLLNVDHLPNKLTFLSIDCCESIKYIDMLPNTIQVLSIMEMSDIINTSEIKKYLPKGVKIYDDDFVYMEDSFSEFI